MEEKLQGLLDKIYQEGVAKGEDVASAIVKDAERKAGKILEEAEREAAEIRRQAREEVEELRRNVASELRLSAGQTIDALRQKISGLITLKAIAEPLDRSFSDQDFIRTTIEQLVQNWNPGKTAQNDLSLLLPAQQEELRQYFSAKAQELLNGTLRVELDRRLEKGFRIGPSDGRYVISFTDKDFEVFFMDYLRPKTREILYGNDH